MTKRAFTLIEVMVTLAILVVLVLVGIPYYFDYVRKSYGAKALANARNCVSAQYYASTNGDGHTPPPGCAIILNPTISCTCTVSGFAGSVTCTLSESGSVSCN